MNSLLSSGVAEQHRESRATIRESAAVLAHHSRSFTLASYFLPRDCRDDAAVLYALCRLVDDIADESSDPKQARRHLHQIRQELVEERPPRPLISVFLKIAHRHELDVAYMLALIDGVTVDIDQVRIETDRDLLQYCYGVAGTVGLMMCAVMEVGDEHALPHAIDLGVAMQLTNICRDVLEDARRDRVYLPARRLRAVGIDPQEVLDESVDRQALAEVVTDILDLAENYYQSAEDGMKYIPVRARLAIVVAQRVYRAIGLRLRRRGSDPMAGRIVVPTSEKLRLTAHSLPIWLGSCSPSAAAPVHDTRLHVTLSGLPGASP